MHVGRRRGVPAGRRAGAGTGPILPRPPGRRRLRAPLPWRSPPRQHRGDRRPAGAVRCAGVRRALATIDVLYDLAFLLMDLLQRDQRRPPTGCSTAICRAPRQRGGPRRPAAVPGAAGRGAGHGHRRTRRARRQRRRRGGGLSRAALKLFDPPPARLIAIGGFSGTGKTTLAAAWRPTSGRRRARCTCAPTSSARRCSGSPRRRGSMPRALRQPKRPRASMAASRSAPVPPCRPGTRSSPTRSLPGRTNARRIEDMARHAGAAFTGIWLSAPGERLSERVAARRGDASDATPEVVAMQMSAAPARLTGRPSMPRAAQSKSPQRPASC
jgi:uncharacterized protein